MSKVNEYFTEEVITKCATEILEAFHNKGSDETVEVDFHLSEGTMEGDLSRPNTWFKFDCDDSVPALQDAIAFLTSLWREEGTSNKDADDFVEIERRIKSKIQELHKDLNLSAALRKNVFQSVPSEILPIDKINILQVEMIGNDEQGYVLKINKKSNEGESSSSVAPELIRIHTETGKSFEQIIEEKQSEGDPNYQNVTGVKYEKYIKDINVAVAADYSFRRPAGLVNESN
jgi:hypothetical protein